MGAKRVLIPKGEKEVRPWWGFGLVKRKIPVYDVKWQKSAQHSNFNQIFSPHDYKGETYEEKKSRAIEDAETNLRFYKELIKERVLPADTKIKIKRLRHTDAYHLEFWMPSVSNLENVGFVVGNHGESVFKRTKKVKKIEEEMNSQIKKIKSIAKEFGYDDELGKDVYAIRNYGYDSKRELMLHDVHILGRELPSKYRKKRTYGKFWYTGNEWVHETESRNKSSLEHKVEKTPIVIIFSLIALILINKSNITGNIIANPISKINIHTLSIIILGAIIIFLLINKKNKKNNG